MFVVPAWNGGPLKPEPQQNSTFSQSKEEGQNMINGGRTPPPQEVALASKEKSII